MKLPPVSFALVLLGTVLPWTHNEAAEKPNILLIVADDLGYSDLGCYGGEIDTPVIDELASEGVRFSDFHVNVMCTVTRTSLLTGQPYSVSNGFKRSIPIANKMVEGGYATSIVGKWHQPGNPLDAGFERFYGFLQGQINSWTGDGEIRTDRGEPGPVPEGWYATDAFTSAAMESMDVAVKDGKPFFCYVAYNAPHSPLHAPKANVEKYAGRFDAGWEALRAQRFERLRKLGLIDDRFVETEPAAEVRRWDELTEEDQKIEAWRMTAYAGMMDRMDENIGRLLAHLDELGVADDTLVIFFSDNGGDYGNGDIATYAKQTPWKKDTLPYVSNGWGRLKNTPFRLYKTSAYAAGVKVPMIVRWPGKIAAAPGSILNQRLHVTDWYPTFLQLAGETYEAGGRLAPLYGKSLLPLLEDPELPARAIHDEMIFELTDEAKGFVSGDWKIVSMNDGPWALFDVANDPAEHQDLAGEQPERVAELEKRFYDFQRNEAQAGPAWRNRSRRRGRAGDFTGWTSRCRCEACSRWRRRWKCR